MWAVVLLLSEIDKPRCDCAWLHVTNHLNLGFTYAVVTWVITIFIKVLNFCY